MAQPEGSPAAQRGDRLKPVLLVGFALALFALIATWAVGDTLGHPNEWRLGDWLVNYSAGFVRRGLTGEVALRCASVFPGAGHLAVSVPILALKLTAGLAFYGTAGLLAARARKHAAIYPLFFSPAFLLFAANGRTIEFRKEILHYAFFASLCWFTAADRARQSERWRQAVLWSVPLVYPAIILSHEMLLVVLPYYFALARLVTKDRRAFLRWSAVTLATSLAAFGATLLARGSPRHAEAVCASLRDRGFDASICNGAISWLGYDSAYGHAAVLEVLGEAGFVPLFVLALVLSAAPVLLAFAASRGRAFAPEMRGMGLAAVASIALMMPIMWVAVDWGRFVHVEFASLATGVLAIHARHPEARGSGRAPRWSSGAAFAAAVALYATSWRLVLYGPPVTVGLPVRAILVLLGKGLRLVP